MQSDPDLVYLTCISFKGKLRVRIITSGYFTEANCQFPRDIRKVNRLYTVPKSAVSLKSRGSQKYYYHIGKPITILNESDTATEPSVPVVPDKVFNDETITECIVCFDEPKQQILVPCGHYCLCTVCSVQIIESTRKCPYCRTRISSIITPEQME